MKFPVLGFLILAATALPAAAQDRNQSQLDFMAGSWTLLDASGATVGSSRVVVQVPGTMLYEERRAGGGGVQSLWFENAERNGGWTQLFVGPAGMTREFKPLSPPATWPMILGADVTLRDGTPVKFRMTLSRLSNDETRRVLQMSRDGGNSWSTVFDYRYRRSSDAES